MANYIDKRQNRQRQRLLEKPEYKAVIVKGVTAHCRTTDNEFSSKQVAPLDVLDTYSFVMLEARKAVYRPLSPVPYVVHGHLSYDSLPSSSGLQQPTASPGSPLLFEYRHQELFASSLDLENTET